MSKFVYIVYDIGRRTRIYYRLNFAKRRRIEATCGRCHPPQSCPHYSESWIVKTRYQPGKLIDILKQYDVGKKFG